MAKKKGTALLMVWTDVPADKEEEFNQWYNEEHIPDLLAIPGFLDAGRYIAISGGPRYLACYEWESPEVDESPAYKRFHEKSTEWARRISPMVIGTNRIRNVYQQIFPGEVTTEVAQSGMAPVLQIGRMSIAPEAEDDFNDWYNTIYIPNFEKVAGCIRGRRYRAISGEPKYATVYEFQNEKVSQTPEWKAAQVSHPRTAQIRPHMTHAPGSPGIYRKIFPV